MIRLRTSLIHVLLPLAVSAVEPRQPAEQLPLAVGAAAATAAMDAGRTTPRRPAEQLEVARGDTTPRRPAEPLQVTRGRCPRRGPRPCLFWLHIQKTGTSFGSTLAAAGCPEQPKQRNVRKWSDGCKYALGAGSHTHSVYQGAARRRDRGHTGPDAAGAARFCVFLRVAGSRPSHAPARAPGKGPLGLG